VGIFPDNFLSEVLSKNKLGVYAATFDELRVSTLLDDCPLVHDNNVVCVSNGRQSMRDDNRGPIGGDIVQRLLDDTLRIGI
jgi:hypothetical protein